MKFGVTEMDNLLVKLYILFIRGVGCFHWDIYFINEKANLKLCVNT